MSGSFLPAVNAASLATPVELHQTLLPHREGRVEKGLLVELRKGVLQALHSETSPALAQHPRDRSLNWRRLAPTRADRNGNPRSGRVGALSGSDWPARISANGLMECALSTLDLFLSGGEC